MASILPGGGDKLCVHNWRKERVYEKQELLRVARLLVKENLTTLYSHPTQISFPRYPNVYFTLNFDSSNGNS